MTKTEPYAALFFDIRIGLGPSSLIFSVISVAYCAKRGPSLDDRLYIWARSPPTPTVSSIFWACSTRRRAIRLPELK